MLQALGATVPQHATRHGKRSLLEFILLTYKNYQKLDKIGMLRVKACIVVVRNFPSLFKQVIHSAIDLFYMPATRHLQISQLNDGHFLIWGNSRSCSRHLESRFRPSRVHDNCRVFLLKLPTCLGWLQEVEEHEAWCKAHGLTGRVWISQKGPFTDSYGSLQSGQSMSKLPWCFFFRTSEGLYT